MGYQLSRDDKERRNYNSYAHANGWDEDELFHCNGIDRIDSNGSYEILNCRTSCRSCNVAKLNRDEKEFFYWARDLYMTLTAKGLL